MKSRVLRFFVCAVSLVLVWGRVGISFADNAAEVKIQISYPSGDDYVAYYNGVVGDIDDSKKDYYVNVHVTLLDVNGLQATAGPLGEEIPSLTATLTTELGVADSIRENIFLSDSATLSFDMIDVGPAARGHVRYACQDNVPAGNVCEPGTDTLTVTVGSLTDTAEVEVKAPDAYCVAIRTLRTPGAGPVDLFDPLPPPSHNAGLAALAGDDIYFEVWAFEENGAFTFAPNLEGEEVTVKAYGDYYDDGKIDMLAKGNERESVSVAEATAEFSGGKATGYITITKAGTNSDTASTSSPVSANSLRVILTATTRAKFKTDPARLKNEWVQNITEAKIETQQLWQIATDMIPDMYPIGSTDAYEATNYPYPYLYVSGPLVCTTDWVAMLPRIKSKLVIGQDPIGTHNYIEEIDDWYVLDDEADGPVTNGMKVYVVDMYGNPVTGESVTISSQISENLESLGVTDTPDGWCIVAGIPPVNVNPGLAERGSGDDDVPTGGGPVEGTLTLSDAGSLLTPDDATVHLTRASAATQGDYGKIDMKMLVDPSSSGATINAGDTVTLYITSDSATSGDYPTTSEIVEYGDKLVVRVLRAGFMGSGERWDVIGAAGNTMLLGGPDSTFETGAYKYEVTAPPPDPDTGAIQVPIKIYGTCTLAAGEVARPVLEVPEKGIWYYVGSYFFGISEQYQAFNAANVIADIEPAAESGVRITELPAGIETDGGLSADPVVITSQFEVGLNSLLLPTSVDTVDEYDNLYNDAPAYGIGSEIGGATVDVTRGASVIYEEDDIGQTDTISINISGVGIRQLQITNIVESVTATALECTREGPVAALNGGEAIMWVRANGNTTISRDIKVAIDTDKSVVDAELRDFSGATLGTSSTLSMGAGSPDDTALRLVVSAPEAGDVVIEASDTTSGVTDLLDTCTNTIRFTELERVPPTAEISPEDGSTVRPTSVIVITIEDNFAVNLGTTQCSVEKDGADITESLVCTQEGDGTPEATITCGKIFNTAYSWGDMAAGSTGLEEGSYVVKTTPQDLMGNVGAEVTSGFTVASCTPVVTIEPASASLPLGGTQQFTASTSCDGTSPAGKYTWDIMTRGCTGSTISNSGLYTAPESISGTACADTVRVTDTANGNATATAGVTVGEITTTTTSIDGDAVITVDPDPMLRSRWVMLPVVMRIQGENTNFTTVQSKVSFSPSNAVVPMPRLVVGKKNILQLVFVNPPWLAGGVEEGSLEVTVTTGAEEATDTVEIKMLPLGLDK